MTVAAGLQGCRAAGPEGLEGPGRAKNKEAPPRAHGTRQSNELEAGASSSNGSRRREKGLSAATVQVGTYEAPQKSAGKAPAKCRRAAERRGLECRAKWPSQLNFG
ncbi:hypothetical protein KM043_000873 [Ampulex compressa]|nr:hypothetical protein KM043_000873 [Ampulex compressa]